MSARVSLDRFPLIVRCGTAVELQSGRIQYCRHVYRPQRADKRVGERRGDADFRCSAPLCKWKEPVGLLGLAQEAEAGCDRRLNKLDLWLEKAVG